MMTHDATKADDGRKLVFRVPEELHAAIKAKAEAEDRSMASWIRRALESALGNPADQT